MSEQRRRLTDAEFTEYAWTRGGPEALRLDRIGADHLQAREDRRRLANKIRKLATYHEAGDGTPLCWTEGGCCIRPGGVPSRRCVEIRILLAEVDPQ